MEILLTIPLNPTGIALLIATKKDTPPQGQGIFIHSL